MLQVYSLMLLRASSAPATSGGFDPRYLNGELYGSSDSKYTHLTSINLAAFGVAWLLWDIVLTLHSEIEHIWRPTNSRMRNTSKVYFLWVRYSTVAGLLLVAYCGSKFIC